MGHSGHESAELTIGQIVGKYRVESLLGTGGMAAVYAAVHVDLDQRVAIKTLLPTHLDDPGIVARFVREAKTIAKVQSKHVAKVFDIGRLETTGAPYIVLELLSGEDLGKKLTRASFPVATAVDYVIEASEGLARAHALGIVHRDVKPGNLFVAEEPGGEVIIKVIDFGIAKYVATDGLKLTHATDVFGSPQYMAPEQIRAAQDVDERSDIWALGIVLYELLTRESAFPGGSVLELAGAILHGPPTPIGRYRNDIPIELEHVLLRCLEKDAEKRHASARDLVLALAPFASSVGKGIAKEMGRSKPLLPSLDTMEGGEDEPTVLAAATSDPKLGIVTEMEMATSPRASAGRTVPFPLPLPPVSVAKAPPEPRSAWGVLATIVITTIFVGGAVLMMVQAKRSAAHPVEAPSVVEPSASVALPPPPPPDPGPLSPPPDPGVPSAAPSSMVTKPLVVGPPAVRPHAPSQARPVAPGRAPTGTPIIPRKGGD